MLCSEGPNPVGEQGQNKREGGRAEEGAGGGRWKQRPLLVLASWGHLELECPK